MSHALYPLFHPQTIAVVGASDRYGSTGRAIFSQLLANQSASTILPINPNHKTIGGFKSYENLHDASEEHAIDVVVVILSADKIGQIVREASKAHIRHMVIINELEQPTPAIRGKLERASELAVKLGVKLLAVSVGGLQGLFHRQEAGCAYIGQSAGIADCMLSYTQSRGITFSRFITLNPQNHPVSTGQLIDFIASEKNTTALLVHISVLDNARELLSALSATAQRKSVFVLSTLANEEQEDLFHQALERRNIFTVQTLTEFLTVAKLLHTGVGARGRRVSILSNTPQISALALKTLPQTHLQLAQVSTNTSRALAKLLPYKPTATTPLYLPSDTAPSIFQASAELFLQDEHSDAVCLIYAGTNTADSRRVAQMTGALQARYPHKPLLMAWLGSADNEEIRQLFNKNKNLHFRQPEHALHALVQLNRYRDHQQNRHRTASYYDYREATDMAHTLREQLLPSIQPNHAPAPKSNTAHFLNALDELQKHLRPLLPTSKTDIAHFLSALKLHQKKGTTQCRFTWQHHDIFGQTLTLATDTHSLTLLPPLTPDIVAQTLQTLDMPAPIWHDWLLDSVEILCRQPELAVEMELHHDVKRGLCCHAIKLDIHSAETDAHNHNIFTPYPFECEETLTLPNGQTVQLRPIRPEDAPLLAKLISGLSERSRQMRFISKTAELPPALLARLSQPDYQREFALIMHDAHLQPLATANYTADADMQSCEFGISLADGLQGQGIGVLLMERIIEHARKQGFAHIRAEILADNHPMQKLALKLGFTLSKHPEDAGMVEAVLRLQA